VSARTRSRALLWPIRNMADAGAVEPAGSVILQAHPTGSLLYRLE